MKTLTTWLLSTATLLAPTLCGALPIDCNIFFDRTNTIQCG